VTVLLLGYAGCSRDDAPMTEPPNILPDVPIVLIDEERKNQYLDQGYNPVAYSDDFTKEQYIDEWYRFFDKLKANVAAHWEHGVDDGDFFMDSDWVEDRFLCIEVSTQRMLQPKLLQIVHQTVAEFDADYSVDVCNDSVFFEHPDYPDGNIGPYFYVFVEKDKILVYSKSSEVLEKFGIKADG
jgi:hypothetical protein